MNDDILLQTSCGLFSYRVAGVLVRDGHVLLHHIPNDPGYSFPGGHASFGETSEEALVREFKEEIGADIRPERLLWLGENFFPLNGQPCHQLCLYYQVSLLSEDQIPLQGSFFAFDELAGMRVNLEFCWLPVAGLSEVLTYPFQARELLLRPSERVERFVNREECRF